jgi:hypothetical protein
MYMRRVILSIVTCPDIQYFSALSHKRHDFRKKVTEHKMCVSIFYATFVLNIFHSKKNWARCDQKTILVLMESTRYSWQIYFKYEICQQIFEQYWNKKFHENSLNLEPSCCVRKERHAEAKSHFRNFANAPPPPSKKLRNCTMAMNRQPFFCFSAASGTSHWNLRMFIVADKINVL